MNNFMGNYNVILRELRKIVKNDNFYFKPIKPKLSYIEVVSLVILAEFKSIDSEHQLFREISATELEGKIERTVYNRRNYAKTFQGFKTRILAKITALTVIQYFNKFVFNRKLNNLKVNLV